jgi:hypothetical protein
MSQTDRVVGNELTTHRSDRGSERNPFNERGPRAARDHNVRRIHDLAEVSSIRDVRPHALRELPCPGVSVIAGD